MSLVKSRRIISALLAMLIVIGSGMFCGSVIARVTLNSQPYMELFFNTTKINNYCESTFKDKEKQFSNESNVPLTVFDLAYQEFRSQDESSISKLYKGFDTKLYSADKVETVEKYIKEYYQGNELKYDEFQVNQLAIDFVSEYSACFAITNIQQASEFLNGLSADCAKYGSSGLLLVAISMGLYLLLYKKKRKLKLAYTSAFTATGFTFILTGIASLILGIGTHARVTPQVYANAISNAIRGDFIILIGLGIVISLVSLKMSNSINNNKLIQ